MAALLSVDGLSVSYGEVRAVREVSVTVDEGEVVTLIGPNGAGKSSLLRAILGLVPSRGSVRFDGIEATSLRADQRVGRGLAMVPEGRRVLARMSVRENLLMGAYARRRSSAVDDDLERVFDRFEVLRERQAQLAGTLSGGQQQMLAIGRALMARPRLLMLDEPSLGLAPLVVSEVFSILRELNADGLTILLVEQNARMALRLAHRGYVLESGSVVLSGDATQITTDDAVAAAYLGR